MKVGDFFKPYKIFNGVIIPNAILKYKDLSAMSKLAWGRLAQYAGKNGQCYPSQDTLADELGISVRYIQKILKELEDQKFIQRINPKKVKRLAHQTNRYKFVWHEVLEESLKDQSDYFEVSDLSPDEQMGVNANEQMYGNPDEQESGSKVIESDKKESIKKNQIVSLETMTDDESSDDSTFINPDPTVGSNEAKIEIQQTQSVEQTKVDSTLQRTPKGTPKHKTVESIPTPKQIQRTLKQKPPAPKPLPKVPANILELIEYWNSKKIVHHKFPNTITYREIVKMLKKLLSASFFDKNGKFGEYADRVFTVEEIKTSIDNFALAAKNYNYMPLNGYKKALQKTGLQNFLHNSYGSEERSYFLEYLNKKPDLAKVSGYLMEEDEDSSLQTLQIKKEYLRITKKEKINSIEDIQRIKFDTVEENKFRLATKRLNAFYKDNKKKFSSWCSSELYNGTMAAKGKRANYFLEFIFKNKGEEVQKICPGNLCSDYSFDNFAKWCTDQGLFEG